MTSSEQTALHFKMAFVSDGQEYTSPSKRIKLDESISETEGNADIEFRSFSTSFKSIKESPETGSFIVNSEATNSDSGFNERNSLTPGDSEISDPGFSLLDTSSQSSQKSEERNGDDDDDDDDDKDEVSSTVSNLSDLSGLSEISGQDWKPITSPMNWVQKQMQSGADPRLLLQQMFLDGQPIPETLNDMTLWKLIYNMLSEPPKRQKLRQINTLSDVIDLLKSSKKIIVLTGAGVSVSCGIPDFRSRDGIYSRLAIDFPDLPDPQAMFDIHYFNQDPRPFFKFAREIYPGLFKPSPCHRFIKMLEKHNKLLRNYSQNIDTLEQVSGIQNVIECHGSFATASCTKCKYKVNADDIREDIFAQRIPLCPKCNEGQKEGEGNNYRGQGIMKPDIVFFGEGLPEIFHSSMAKDKDECDLLIVIGSSLKVRPVALIPNSIPAHVPQILINREPLQHFDFDVEFLGDSDVIINQICHLLGEEWNDVCWIPSPLSESKHLLPAYNLKLNSKIRWENGVHLTPTTVEMSEADSLHMSVDSVDSSLGGASCTVLKERHSDATKERHMSIDSSTRDSGVGFLADSPASGLEELSLPYSQSQTQSITQPQPSTSRAELSSSDCAIKGGVSRSDLNKPDSTSKSRHMSIEDDQSSKWQAGEENEDFDELRSSSWENRSKESLSSRLAANTYYYMSPSRYIFPGAEVYADDDKYIEHYYSSNGTSTSSSEGSEAEERSTRYSVEESDHDEDGTSKPSEESKEHPTEDNLQKMMEWVFQKSS